MNLSLTLKKIALPIVIVLLFVSTKIVYDYFSNVKNATFFENEQKGIIAKLEIYNDKIVLDYRMSNENKTGYFFENSDQFAPCFKTLADEGDSIYKAANSDVIRLIKSNGKNYQFLISRKSKTKF